MTANDTAQEPLSLPPSTAHPWGYGGHFLEGILPGRILILTNDARRHLHGIITRLWKHGKRRGQKKNSGDHGAAKAWKIKAECRRLAAWYLEERRRNRRA